MPIKAILESEYGAVFEPTDIAVLAAAFPATLSKLGLGRVEHAHPLRTPVAKLIIQLAKGWRARWDITFKSGTHRSTYALTRK